MPVRIYNPGISADLRPTATRAGFTASDGYSVHHHVSYAESLARNPTVTSRTSKAIRADTRMDAHAKLKLHTEQEAKSMSGQRADFWKPYKPLGNMSSVLHLKVVRITEDHLTGDRTKKILKLHNAKDEESEEEEEDEEEEWMNNGKSESDSKKPAPPKTNKTNVKISFNRVMNLARSIDYKMIRARVKEGTKIAKFVAAGTPIQNHLTQRTVNECIDFAIEQVASNPDKREVEVTLYEILRKYDYGGGRDESEIGRSESRSSLASRDDTNSVTGSLRGGNSSASQSQTSSSMPSTSVPLHQPQAPSIPPPSSAAPNHRNHRASLTVSDKLNSALTTAPLPDQPINVRTDRRAAGITSRNRRNFLNNAAVVQSVKAEANGHPNTNNNSASNSQRNSHSLIALPVASASAHRAEIEEDHLSAVESLYRTVKGIFASRKAFEQSLHRHLTEIDFSWPQHILDRSNAFLSEPAHNLPTIMHRFSTALDEYSSVVLSPETDRRHRADTTFTTTGSYYSDEETNLEMEEPVLILTTPRTFATHKAELVNNARIAASNRSQTTSTRLHNSLWFIQVLRTVHSASKGKQLPVSLLTLLHCIRKLIVSGFDMTLTLLLKLYLKVLTPGDHKSHIVYTSIRSLNKHLSFSPSEYLQWLKENNIVPLGSLIREVKKMQNRSKARGSQRTHHRRKKKTNVSSLRTLGEGLVEEEPGDGDEEFGSSTSDLHAGISPRNAVGGRKFSVSSFLMEEVDESVVDGSSKECVVDRIEEP
ncbi:hypothetical protein TrLO_g1157 [Triparma laevis f. longispina]|uniref:Uncharacterized protein n=1 Tax=Triparma laevis f. longispina TaxID=1714387 RepID=A0A9W7FKC8_9STRA|nr:hypothetical protein TrLO_g1157 [Triparma laevis f. longispina]